MKARAKTKPRARAIHPAQLALVWGDPKRTRAAIERGERRRGNDVPRDHAKPETRDEARHVAHCCSNHGCAHGADDDCPVVALAFRQRSACGAAEPCSREQVAAPRLPPRRMNFKVPESPGDPRTAHLIGGTRR